jgi:hypothetical protein
MNVLISVWGKNTRLVASMLLTAKPKHLCYGTWTKRTRPKHIEHKTFQPQNLLAWKHAVSGQKVKTARNSEQNFHLLLFLALCVGTYVPLILFVCWYVLARYNCPIRLVLIYFVNVLVLCRRKNAPTIETVRRSNFTGWKKYRNV